MGLRRPGSGFHLRRGGILPAPAQVIGYRTAEEDVVLQHHPHLRMKLCQRIVAYIRPVDEHFAAGHDVVAVAQEQFLGLDGVVQIADQCGVVRFVQVVDAEIVLDLGDARIKDADPSAKIVVLSMGPEQAKAVLKESLAIAADKAYLVSDRAFGGSDTLATSYIISETIKKVEELEGKFDIIFCGKQAIDGDTAQVGPQIAEKLKLPQICYVEEVVELGKGKVVARRAIDGGYEVLESPLPALMTVIDSNEPRPMNAKLIMKYKRARTPSEVAREFTNSNYTEGNELDARLRSLETKGLLIKEYSATDINADPARIGFPGSPTKVKQVMSVVLTASEAKSVPATAEGINELIHELISDHTLG